MKVISPEVFIENLVASGPVNDHVTVSLAFNLVITVEVFSSTFKVKFFPEKLFLNQNHLRL